MATSPPPTDGDEFECRVESLAAGGDGVAHAPDGRVLFVPQTAPGDRVRVRIERRRARFARARVQEVLEPGPDRREPFCSVFGKCGGCQWQHVAYPAQVRAKAAILRDAIERLAGLRCPEPLAFTPSPHERGYRTRARLIARAGRLGLRRHRSHEVCALTRCPVLVPELEETLSGLGRRRAVLEPTGEREWEIAVGDAEARAVASGASGPSLELLLSDGHRLRLSTGVFSQANRFLIDPLARAVERAIGGRPGGRLLELYAGAGLFTLRVAPRFDVCVAVESSPAAAADLAWNVERAGGAVGVRCDRVEHALAELREDGARFDAVLLDPPRVGLDPASPEDLAALGAERIVYVSCDPATLARDLRRLAEYGYTLTGLEGFDLFPQTPHVEAIAVLERRAAA